MGSSGAEEQDGEVSHKWNIKPEFIISSMPNGVILCLQNDN
jgi:hypothetical protein